MSVASINSPAPPPAGVAEYDGGFGWIAMMLVEPAYRGRGLGTGLTRWAMAYLTSRGVKAIRLDSTAEAERLYEALGFRAVGRRFLYHLEARPRIPCPPG
jgi:ribosomal protein S18 acetylase RimI-like enzyme